jgi:hypothetical protein
VLDRSGQPLLAAPLQKICVGGCFARLDSKSSWGMRPIIPMVSVVLALAASVGWLLGVEQEQARQIAKLKADVIDKSAQQSLTFKRQCAGDADRYFRKWNNVQTPSTAQVGYESHYNPSQKACFVLIQYTDPSREYFGLQLFDAVEQRQYADFSSEEALIFCHLIPSDGEQKPCNSKAALSAFVASYMEAAPDLP